MPFKKTPPPRTARIRDLAEDWGRVVARRAVGAAGPADAVDFETFEPIAVAAAEALTTGMRRAVTTPEGALPVFRSVVRD
jgi:hypothetical protein